MKKKISRILGVVLTLALLSSLAIVSAPVSADVQKWDTFATPSTTGMVLNTTITAADAFAQSPVDGALYAAVTDAGVFTLLKSIDGGRTWKSLATFTGVAVPAVAATGTSTIPAGVTALDLALDIDGAATTLAYGDDATAIAGKIAAAVTTSGTVTTATSAGATVTFTARVAGAAANGALTIADNSYGGGTVPAVTLTGGVDAVAQVDTVTPTVVATTEYNLMITVGASAWSFSYTSDGTPLDTEIVAAFVALVNAVGPLTVTASGTTTLILTADVAGTAGVFTTASLGPGVLAIAYTTAAVDEAMATGNSTIPAGVTALDLALDIDGAATTLAYGDDATAIAGKIAAAVTTSGTVTTATSAGATVTFTARVAGAAANGALTIADNSYGGGTVPAVTLAGGADATSVGALPAVAIVPSATEANVIFYADSRTLYKSIDGGVTFMPFVSVPVTDAITALDVAKWGGRYIAVVGTDAVTMTAGAYYWDESLAFHGLTPVGSTTFGYPVLAVAMAPTFATDRAVVAIGTDLTGDTTKVRVNVNGGAWGAVVADVSFGSGADATAADIAFFSDFNATTSPIYFIAVSDATAADGGVYRIIGNTPTGITTAGEDTWTNLAVSGSFASGTASLLVGSSVGTVKKSTNSGFSFSAVTLRSNVATKTAWVLFDKDYATSKKAYVLNVGGAGSAFNVTVDSMAFFNQWSLVNETISTIDDLAIASNGDMFMITGAANNIWRYFGGVWERVAVGITGNIIRVSPAYATDKAVMYALTGSTNAILISPNNANSFMAQPTAPGSTYGSANAISTLLMLAANSVVVGSTGGVITTSTNGYYWPEVTVTGLGDVQSLARDAGTGDILAGSASTGVGKVALSQNNGATWALSTNTIAAIDTTLIVALGSSYASTGEMYATGTDSGGDAGVWKRTTGDWSQIDKILTNPQSGTDDVKQGTGLVSAPGISGVDMVYAADAAAGEGVYRIKANRSEGEQMSDGTSTFMGLWYEPGSNKLYTVDTAAPRIRTYTDTLNRSGTGVAVSAITTTTAAVSWTDLPNAATYLVVVNTTAQTNFYTAANSGAVAVAVNDDANTAAITSLASGVTYNVSVWGWTPVSSFQFNAVSFTTLPTPPTPPVGLVPANGAINIPVLGPAFAWSPPAVPGITGYNFELTTDPTFATITVGTASPAVPYLVWAGPLEYETAYYWRVRAVTAAGTSAWVTSVFTTVAEAEPPVTVEPAPTPTIILPTPTLTVIPPDIDVTVVPPDIIVDIPQPTTTIVEPVIEWPEEVTPAYIWAIVAIGAVLVIAVIMLIIRTRRVV